MMSSSGSIQHDRGYGLRKRTSRENPAITQSQRVARRNDFTAQTPSTPTSQTQCGEFFKATEWTIFNDAHEMVKRLVFPANADKGGDRSSSAIVAVEDGGGAGDANNDDEGEEAAAANVATAGDDKSDDRREEEDPADTSGSGSPSKKKWRVDGGEDAKGGEDGSYRSPHQYTGGMTANMNPATQHAQQAAAATMGHPHHGTAAHHHGGREDGPYRRKLIDLATSSIANVNGLLEKPIAVTPEQVVAQAWESVEYLWCKTSDSHIKRGKSSAFSTMGKTAEAHFPIIAISESFRDNDYRTGQTSNQPTTMDRKTLLLFFRKIKHEFLHVVHRFLEIHHMKTFSKTLAPDRYTPLTQNNRNRPAPEVGDHDEEEDSGGPILPLHPNQKLSEANPLCLYFNKKFLLLEDTQVEGLLDLNLYLQNAQREEKPHHDGIWSAFSCRAFIRKVLTEDFYDNETVASNPSAPSSSVSSNNTSRSSSPATTNLHNFEAPVALWRELGQIAFVFHPTSNTVSRSDSPVGGL